MNPKTITLHFSHHPKVYVVPSPVLYDLLNAAYNTMADRQKELTQGLLKLDLSDRVDAQSNLDRLCTEYNDAEVKMEVVNGIQKLASAPEMPNAKPDYAAVVYALQGAMSLLEHASCFYSGPHSAEFNILPQWHKVLEDAS